MGALLSQPVTDQKSGEKKGDFVSCGFTSMQGWRRTMEDAHDARVDMEVDGKKFSFFGVFDGHGGDQVALYCEDGYYSTLTKNEFFKKGDYTKALEQTNIEVDEQLKTEEVNAKLKTIGNGTLFDSFGDLVADGVGCTSVVSLVIDNKIYCGNAGDSRCILYKGDKVIPLSIDHKPSLQSEIDRIAAAGGKIEEGRVNGNLNLTRTLGDLFYKKDEKLRPEQQIISCFPDVTVTPLDGTEKLLVLACDGIWDVLSNDQCIEKIEGYLSQGLTLQQTCEKVTMDCLSKSPYNTPGWDNMTLVIVKFNSYTPPKVEKAEVSNSNEGTEIAE